MPKPPGSAVSNHSIPNGFRNNQAEPRTSGHEVGFISCVVSMHDNSMRPHATPTLNCPTKLCRRSELVRCGKHGLSSQLCATLLAASRNDGTTRTGGHTGTEAVLTSTTTVIWLECTLSLCHDILLSVHRARRTMHTQPVKKFTNVGS